MHGENDNLVIGKFSVFEPSKLALFLPLLVVAGGYLALVFWLTSIGLGGSAVARLGMVVLAVGMPILVAHATLRLFTISLRPMANMVLVHTGFPRSEPFEIPYPLIRRIKIKRGIGGRIAGSGTLVFELVTGQSLSACDLAKPQEAKAVIEDLMDNGTVEPRSVSSTVPQAVAMAQGKRNHGFFS